MSSLLEKLKLGTLNTKLMKWPGTDQAILLRVLSMQERQDATFATERLFKSQKIDVNMVSANEYDSEYITQILFRAIRNPEKPDEQVCENITEFRKALTLKERQVLSEEYIAFEEECSPAIENQTQDQWDALVSSLKKNPTETLGKLTSIATLKKLLLITVSQPVSLPKVN